MTIPANVLRNVVTYQEGITAAMVNQNAFVSSANTKFKDFENLIANLGQSVTFDKPPRGITIDSLVAQFQAMEQRYETLTANKPASFAYAFNNEQFIYNVHDYMEKFGRAAASALGAKVEKEVAKACIQDTYRFYGDGVTPINSYLQLSTALAYFRDYGAINHDFEGFLPLIAAPAIINSGLSQFVLKRNEEKAQSWELGEFNNCKWMTSNLLPIHVAGTVGNGASAPVQTLTVVSVDDPTGNAVTQITCTCDGSLSGSADAIKQDDVGVFLDVAGLTNIRYLTWQGYGPSANPVQIRMTADAGASGTTVVLSIFPTLQWTVGANQNLSTPIVPGMKIKIMPSHRAGMITSGKTLYLAMPRLPDQSPFATSNKVDPETGVSVRMTHGAMLGQNTIGTIVDTFFGYKQVPENAMRILFPL